MVEVVVRAGIVGKSSDADPDDRRYPSTTSDVVKLLREQGLSIAYEHEKEERDIVALHALEYWLPVLDFSMNVLANVPANIMATTIMNFFHGDRKKAETSVLHVRYKVQSKDGDVVEFEGNGLGKDVLKAMDRFERDVRH